MAGHHDSLSVHIHQAGVSELKAAARGHDVTVDRPLVKGGTDRGPLGGEYLLVALGGCFLSNILAAGRARGADLSGVDVFVTGSIADAPPRFEAIDMRVVAALADRAVLRKLLDIAGQACIVTNSLKPGVRLSVRLDDAVDA